MKTDNINPSQLSPLVLAYIGDGVYELYVRNKIIYAHPDMPPHKLHILSSSHVKAAAQSKSMLAIEPMLTEEELAIYKRGRNAKSATVPKNADVTDYRRATGFEALIGYLYLTKNSDRLDDLMEIAYNTSVN
ncbi:MAG: Mini-ribonuclease 3 [Clostridia bacterium]|nr:Mini-ribonuclease 3 [Clostridia bacterium]